MHLISSEIEKRRHLFDLFAKSKEFNPLDAEKWYGVTEEELSNGVRVSFISDSV
jgi:hypothetical protein